MFNNAFIILFSLISLLSGCVDNSLPKNTQDDWKNISDWHWFALQSPTNFREHILRDDGSVALTTYDTSISKRIDSDYSIHLYPSLSSPCSPSLTGVSEPTPLTIKNGTGAWGRSDYWDDTAAGEKLFYKNQADGTNTEPPLCRPPIDSFHVYPGVECIDSGDIGTDCVQPMRDYEVQHGIRSAYAFCSQKDGKTVVICISQMKDEPELAKKIFGTFGWTSDLTP